ncbi:MAG: GNAT family protein [bacterium]
MPLDRSALASPPMIATADLRLEPMGPQHFEGMWGSLGDPEMRRLTGTHRTFTEPDVRAYLDRLVNNDERADFAMIRTSDKRYLGEAVLNELDEANRAMNFRIALASADLLGHGYGTRATQAVLDFGFDLVRLHRIALGVYAFNPRAEHVYTRCGFLREGRHRDALHWDGAWHDEITMAILATDPRPWHRPPESVDTVDR